MQVIKDDDWWVRTRAADALGKIGGPRVVDAVIELIRDEDEEVRRAAIEILNQTKDERAVNFLIEATKDKDWWVSERAVDALAEIGSKKAVPALIDAAENRQHPLAADGRARARQAGRHARDRIARAAAGSARERNQGREPSTPSPASPTTSAPTPCATTFRPPARNANDQTIEHAAIRAIEDIDLRYSSTAVAAAIKAGRTGVEPARVPAKHWRGTGTHAADRVAATSTRCIKKAEESGSRHRRSSTSATLKLGEHHRGPLQVHREDRQGRVRHGRAVDGRHAWSRSGLILKFLNPNVAQDEEMMKRFVHELRYSRKITHKNVIRIYDFCSCAATTRSRWSTSRRTRSAAKSSTRSRCRCTRAHSVRHRHLRPA